MRESKHQIEWNKYLRTMRQNNTPLYGVFELKQTSTDRISFNCLEEGQRAGLPAIKKRGFVWKISDADPRLKPCDSISLPPMDAYIVIRYPKCFCVIDIETFLELEKESGAKTLHLDHAKRIAYKIIHV